MNLNNRFNKVVKGSVVSINEVESGSNDGVQEGKALVSVVITAQHDAMGDEVQVRRAIDAVIGDMSDDTAIKLFDAVEPEVSDMILMNVGKGVWIAMLTWTGKPVYDTQDAPYGSEQWIASRGIPGRSA